ncbi:TPA: hypothetical protein ACLBIK_000086 [Neisseria meningitidis]|nr:hypothetical protein [Neisseria meningitidis]
MAVLLNLFFDDYGLPSCNVWVFFAIALCIIDIIIDEYMPIFIVLASFALFFALFYPITSINPYNYIPISGTDTQKANLKRCTAGKTVNLENIKDIMTDCKNHNQEMKFSFVFGKTVSKEKS